MREHAGAQHLGRERMRDEQGRGRDEAIDDDEHARTRRAQVGAGHHRDLEAAELGEQGQGRERARIATARGPHEQFALARQACVVEAGAAADEAVERGAAQARGDEAGRCGVADAHFAEADRIAAGVGPGLRQGMAARERIEALLFAHRAHVEIILGA